MLLSFILPVYNVEPYITRCLDSIYKQNVSEKDYEVIVVDDGSTDNSLELVKQYSEKHSNLVVFSKENGGVSSARNKGIDLAQGDYLSFVDPDDYICDKSLSSLMKSLNKEDDIIIFRSKTSSGKEFIFDWKYIVEEDKSYSGLELFAKYSRGCCWGCVFKRDFLKKNQILFPLGVKNGEDSIFMALSMAVADSISFYDIDFYNLFRRDDSASQKITETSISRMKYTLDAIKELRISSKYSNEQKLFFERSTYGAISALTSMAMLVPMMNYSRLCQIVPVAEYLPIKHNRYFKQRLKIRLVNYSYRLYFFLCRVKCLYKKPKFI